MDPTPVLLPGKSHGWSSLVGCSPWGRQESDTTERLHFHFSALEKETATHSSVLAWRIPGTGEPGGLPVTQSHTRLKWLSSSSSTVNGGEIPSNPTSPFNPIMCAVLCSVSSAVSTLFTSDSLLPYGLCSPPGSLVYGILQARLLEWVAMPSSRRSSWPTDWTWISCTAGRFFTTSITWEATSSWV